MLRTRLWKLFLEVLTMVTGAEFILRLPWLYGDFMSIFPTVTGTIKTEVPLQKLWLCTVKGLWVSNQCRWACGPLNQQHVAWWWWAHDECWLVEKLALPPGYSTWIMHVDKKTALIGVFASSSFISINSYYDHMYNNHSLNTHSGSQRQLKAQSERTYKGCCDGTNTARLIRLCAFGFWHCESQVCTIPLMNQQPTTSQRIHAAALTQDLLWQWGLNSMLQELKLPTSAVLWLKPLEMRVGTVE